MAIAIQNGTYATAGGIPQEIGGLEELLQAVSLRFACRRGSFRYGRQYGSRMFLLNPDEEHVQERALALANEALLDLPGVTALQVEQRESEMIFTVQTPLGTGKVCYQIREKGEDENGEL